MKRSHNVINIAIFLIFLVVMIPIHSSVVLAALINSANAYGSAEIPGFRARTDTTTVNVTATITEDSDIGPGQVKVLENPTVPFECTVIDEATGLFNCISEYSEMTLDPNAGVMPFTVQIFADNGAPLSPPRQGSLIVDSKPPKLIGATYVTLPDGIVEATYDVMDEACDAPACANRCAGVARIGFSVASLNVGEGIIEDTACEQTGKVNLTPLVVGEDVQTKHICVEAVDKLGQSATPKCKDVVIDTKPPVVEVGLYDINNRQVLYTNGQPICNLNLVINITEDSKLVDPRAPTSQVSIILVNASQLSERPDYQAAFSKLPLECKNPTSTNKYTCTYGVCLIVSSQKDISVHVEAADEFGNVFNDSKPVSIQFDNTPPVATKIYTNYVDDRGVYWMAEVNTTILMDITEAVSGMSNRYATLDFSSFGPQPAISGSATLVTPNECVPGWTCKWYGIRTDKPSNTALYLTPKVGSRDDAGNAMTEVTSPIKVDKDAPVVLRNISNITGTGESHTAMLNISGGDTIEVNLFVKDYSGLKNMNALANFSEMVEGGTEAAEGACEENQVIAGEPQRIFKCTWSAGPIKEGYLGPLANNAPSIYFKFEDNTNHTTVYEWDDIEILKRENVTIPTWKVVVVKSSPELGMDRLTWQLSQQRMFFQLQFTTLRGDPAVPLSVQLNGQSCTSLEYVNVDPLTNDVAVRLLGYTNYQLSPEPPFFDLAEIDMNPESVPETERRLPNNSTVPFEGFDVNCTMTITSIVKIGNERSLTLPEEVNVSFHVPVYNNNLGNNIGNIKDQIDAMEAINNKFYFLTILRQIFEVLQQICDLVTVLIQVDAAVAAVKDIFGGLCATERVAGGGAVSCSVSGSMADVLEGDFVFIPEFVKEVYSFCGLFISCRPTVGNDCTTGNTGTWCEVQTTWRDVTTWLSKYLNEGMSDAFLTWGGAPAFSTSSFNPKLSIFSSVYTLCLPGIILNLEKFRQIHCQKILCYKVDVAAGRPIWRCDQEYDFLVCTHLTGQAFAALPLFQFWNAVGGMIEGIFRNPWGLIGFGVDKACNIVCSSDATVFCSVCRFITWMPAVANIIVDLVESTESRWNMALYDRCDEALKDEPSYSNIAPPVPQGGTGAAGD